jgi:hypothetical protein
MRRGARAQWQYSEGLRIRPEESFWLEKQANLI